MRLKMGLTVFNHAMRRVLVMIAGYGFIAFLGWLLFLRISGQHKSDQHDTNPITSDISKNVLTGSSLTTTTVEPETSNSELHESQPTTEGTTEKIFWETLSRFFPLDCLLRRKPLSHSLKLNSVIAMW